MAPTATPAIELKAKAEPALTCSGPEVVAAALVGVASDSVDSEVGTAALVGDAAEVAGALVSQASSVQVSVSTLVSVPGAGAGAWVGFSPSAQEVVGTGAGAWVGFSHSTSVHSSVMVVTLWLDSHTSSLQGMVTILVVAGAWVALIGAELLRPPEVAGADALALDWASAPAAKAIVKRAECIIVSEFF
jgi:hypothetical protein